MRTPANKHGQEPRKHHYVPEFCLRPWAKTRRGQLLLRGYYWDHRTKRLRYRDRGVGAFCYGLDLLTFKRYRAKPAVLEARFFQAVDQKGRAAIDAMVTRGTAGMTNDERCDFVRLLLSLEWRRPAAIQRLRVEGKGKLADGLDSDPDVLAEFKAQGIAMKPSEYVEQVLGWSLEDRSLMSVQRLVDSKEIGERLVNAYWHLRTLKREHSSFVLGDRPLVRIAGLNHEAATWFLPLGPKLGFYATINPRPMKLIKNEPSRRLVSRSNSESALQAERFVFSTDSSHEAMLAKFLRR